MMIEGIRVGLKEELQVGPRMLGTPAVFKSICLSPFHLVCIVGLVSVGLAFSAAAQFVSASFDVAVSYAASPGSTMSVVAAEAPENDQSPSETETLTNKANRKVSERDATPNPSIGVELVCGLALFLWVQRFRNSLV
jgi:hypothetical protein